MKDLYPSRHAARPELLPRLDPVVHSEWSEDAPISREQAEHFETQGYLVLDDIFTDEEVAALQAGTGKLLADPSALDPLSGQGILLALGFRDLARRRRDAAHAGALHVRAARGEHAQ